MQDLVVQQPILNIAVGAVGGTLTSNLPATNWLDHIRVSYSLTINTAGAKTVHADGLARTLTIRLYHGSDPIINLEGQCLKNWLEVVLGRTELYTDFTAAAGEETGTWDFIIPRSMYDLADSESSLEDLATGSNSRIEFQFNGPAAASPTAGAAVVAPGGSITIEVVTQKRDPNIPLKQVLPVVRLEQDTFTDLVASTADQLRLVNPGWWYRRFLFIIEDNATTIARSNTIVSAVQRIFNQERFGKETVARLRVQNWSQRPIIGRTAPPTGVVWFFWDETHTFNPLRMLDTTKSLQSQIGFDTAAAANGIRVRVVREIIVPGKVEAVRQVAADADRKSQGILSRLRSGNGRPARARAGSR